MTKSLALMLFVAAKCFAVPLSFEQRDPSHFLARFGNGSVELRPDRVILRDLTLRFIGATTAARLEGLGSSAPSTYLRAGFVRTFPQFPKLAIHDLYAGVDAVFYGAGGNLEYDLKLAAGASLDRIRISFEGARDIHIDGMGNLTIETASGLIQQMRPRVFQRNREVSSRYALLAANQVGIRLGKHDRPSPLTIDPVLAYTKYFGGSGSSAANLISTDAQGNIYVAGQSNSPDFPTTSNGFEPKAAPPLQVLSSVGKTITPLHVDGAISVGAIGGTADGTILYAAASNGIFVNGILVSGIFVSGDSGATWRQTAPLPVAATVANIALDPLDPATLLVATNRGLFGSDSGGQFWGQRDTGLPVSADGSVWVTSVFYSPVNPLIAYATTNSPSYLFASSDAGNTWTPLNPTYPGEPPAPTDPYPPVAATLTPDGSILFAVNGNGTLLESADGGASWVKLAQGLYGSTVIKVDPSNSNTLYVLDQLGLQKSVDGGQTFSKVASPTSPREFAIDSSGALYVAGFNLIYVSADSGNTFAAVTALNVTTLTALAGNVYAGSITPSVPFVIKFDPTGSTVLYSTFLGGSLGDVAQGLTVDSQGNAVLAGYTLSPDFPLTVPPANPLSANKPAGFVAKLSADGTHLIYSLALGGSQSTFIRAVAVDPSGAIYVTGQTASTDFPTTAKVVQPTVPAGSCPLTNINILATPNIGSNAFVSKISPDGSSLVYSTFLTGTCGSGGQGLAVDAAGNAIVVGYTASPDFPVSPNTYQPGFPGPINQPNQRATAVAGFVTRLSPAADKILASSYLGGGGYTTQAGAVELDAAGNAYITGFTQGFTTGPTRGAYQTNVVDRCTPPISIGPSFPYTGTGDAFVLKLDPALSSARFLTYLGGACDDSGSSIALDPAGNIWVSGTTQSPDFPLNDPFQTSSKLGFVSELSADASQLLFSSFSQSTALALTPTAVYLAGASGASAFVAKIDPATTPAVSIDSITPVICYPPSTVEPFTPGLAPGQLIQISGRNLGPATQVNAQLDAFGRLPFVLGNTTVLFNNIPAPLISVQASSIMCFVPFEITSTTQISVSSNGQLSQAVQAVITSSAPQILSIVNQDGAANSAAHPAKTGSVISLYVSGLGETAPLSVDGLVNTAPLSVPLAPVVVYSSGRQINPSYVGSAPGMIAGITQVNVPLPSTAGGAAGMASNGVGISVNSAGATVYVTQ